MKRNPMFSIVLLVLPMTAVLLDFYSSAPVCGEISKNPHPVAAVLINNDPSELHCGNLRAALNACRKLRFDEILTFGEGKRVPTLSMINNAMADLQRRGVRIGMFYLTGHGSLYRSPGQLSEEACVMLKDAPLRAGSIVTWLGKGSCVVYADTCYAPTLLHTLQKKIRGNVVLLTDKPEDQPMLSCRGVSTRFWRQLGESGNLDDLQISSIHAWETMSSRGIQFIQEVAKS